MPESPVRLETDRLVLSLPGPAEAADVVAFFRANRAHLDPWSPPRPDGFYDEAHWQTVLERYREELRADVSLRLFARHRASGAVVATVSFTQFFRGPLQRCILGFAIDHRHQGIGLMREAVAASIPYVFDELRFHRIEANHRPENERSARLFSRLGFVREGYARNYLFIDGAWRDHVLNSLTNPNPSPPER